MSGKIRTILVLVVFLMVSSIWLYIFSPYINVYRKATYSSMVITNDGRLAEVNWTAKYKTKLFIESIENDIIKKKIQIYGMLKMKLIFFLYSEKELNGMGLDGLNNSNFSDPSSLPKYMNVKYIKINSVKFYYMKENNKNFIQKENKRIVLT